jgi:iron complex outermembrane receptor protein
MLLTTSALIGAVAATPGAALAQASTAAAPTATSPGTQGSDPQTSPNTAINPGPGDSEAVQQADILVTARRRNESIVDVPLAITVVGAATLEKLDITSTSQLANFVPGLQFSDFTPGNSRNDRGGNRPIIFRGLNLARNGGVTGAGSMFLDGAAVIGNEIPGSMDIGAVEVLRGPQNVYFGRASMTGAISYRTKAIPDTWTYGLDMTLAQRDTHRVEASVAGPLIDGLLGIRVTGLQEMNDGFITNAFAPDGDKLGARSRKSISATIDFTPADALEIKLYANYFRDEDGPSATVNIFPDATITTAAGPGGVPLAGTVTALGAVTNCVRGIPFVTPGSPVGTIASPARPTICGRVPDVSRSIAYSRTIIPTDHASDTFSVPFLQGEGFERKAGLQRNAFNSHGIVNLTISDYLKLQSITGYHTNAVIQAVDGIGRPAQATSAFSILFFGLSNKFADFSQEFRLSSDPERAFSWTIGGTYVNAKNLSNATNTRTLNVPAQTYARLLLNIGDDRAKTYGGFAGAYLKLVDDRLTLSAEGRYQVDKRRNTQIAFLTGVPINSVAEDFKSFNPRVSIDFDVGGGRKLYASYAQGSRPGGFNNGLASYFDASNSIYAQNPATPTVTPPTVAAVTAAINNIFGVTDPTFDEEKLAIYELGFKGQFAGGDGYFDINAYYGTLSEQQITFQSLVPLLATSLSVTVNSGELEIYGVEFTGNYNFNRELSVNTSFAWNKTNRTRYIDTTPANIRLYGFSDYAGLETPNTPEITASGVISYEGQSDDDSWAPFGTIAAVYRGRQWADIANFAYIPGRATVDLRLGAKNGPLRLEAFVTNVTNNKTYPGGNVASDFGSPANFNGSDQGFFGAYADPRTFGGRLSVRF